MMWNESTIILAIVGMVGLFATATVYQRSNRITSRYYKRDQHQQVHHVHGYWCPSFFFMWAQCKCDFDIYWGRYSCEYSLMFTIVKWGYQLLALLGRVRYHEYEVTMCDDVENVRTEYVLAPDCERAAWQALELSSQRNCTLKNVRMCDEW